jgi:hypothetical protein
MSDSVVPARGGSSLDFLVQQWAATLLTPAALQCLQTMLSSMWTAPAQTWQKLWLTWQMRRMKSMIEFRFSTKASGHETVNNDLSDTCRAMFAEYTRVAASATCGSCMQEIPILSLAAPKTQLLPPSLQNSGHQIVSQHAIVDLDPVLLAIDAAKGIYCTLSVTETNAVLRVCSDTLSKPTLVAYVDEATCRFVANFAATRRGKLYMFDFDPTLLGSTSFGAQMYGAPVHKGWTETRMTSTMTFDHMFFEGKDRLVENIRRFLESEELYRRRGQPWTFGLLLHGPPGTGKTSVIKAIINMTRRHAVNVCLGAATQRSQLVKVFTEEIYVDDNKEPITHRDKVFVLEDIDADSPIVLKRAAAANCVDPTMAMNFAAMQDMVADLTAAAAAAAESKDRSANRLNGAAAGKATLSNLLNLIQGIGDAEGRFMVATTNHVDKLDPALIRPGRFNVHVEMGFSRAVDIADMARSYFGASAAIDSALTDGRFPDRALCAAEVVDRMYSASDVDDFLTTFDMTA